MSKRQILCILGVWIIIFLFLGFPFFLHRILAIITGFLVIIVAYNLGAPVDKASPSTPKETFVENKQP